MVPTYVRLYRLYKEHNIIIYTVTLRTFGAICRRQKIAGQRTEKRSYVGTPAKLDSLHQLQLLLLLEYSVTVDITIK